MRRKIVLLSAAAVLFACTYSVESAPNQMPEMRPRVSAFVALPFGSDLVDPSMGWGVRIDALSEPLANKPNFSAAAGLAVTTFSDKFSVPSFTLDVMSIGVYGQARYALGDAAHLYYGGTLAYVMTDTDSSEVSMDNGLGASLAGGLDFAVVENSELFVECEFTALNLTSEAGDRSVLGHYNYWLIKFGGSVIF